MILSSNRDRHNNKSPTEGRDGSLSVFLLKYFSTGA